MNTMGSVVVTAHSLHRRKVGQQRNRIIPRHAPPSHVGCRRHGSGYARLVQSEKNASRFSRHTRYRAILTRLATPDGTSAPVPPMAVRAPLSPISYRGEARLRRPSSLAWCGKPHTARSLVTGVCGRHVIACVRQSTPPPQSWGAVLKGDVLH